MYSSQNLLESLQAMLDKNAQYSPMLHFKLVIAADIVGITSFCGVSSISKEYAPNNRIQDHRLDTKEHATKHGERYDHAGWVSLNLLSVKNKPSEAAPTTPNTTLTIHSNPWLD
jgi:hypothetical protein